MSLPKPFKNKNKGKPSLPSLPKDKDSLDITPEALDKLSKSDFYDNSYEIIEELMLNDELTEEHIKIRKSYEDIVDIFQQSSTINENKSRENKNKLKEFNFQLLDEFETAINNGVLNINNYSITEINNLIRELSQLENKVSTRNLEDYKFRTVDEFQEAVDKGLLKLSEYDIKEINKLLEQLEDEGKHDYK